MFRHNVGKMFLYNPTPEPANFEVNVPLFNPGEFFQPELLMQLEDDVLSDPARRRKRAIQGASALPPEVLARRAEFGVYELHTLAEVVSQEFEHENSLLRWKGVSAFEEAEATIGVPWNIAGKKTGIC